LTLWLDEEREKEASRMGRVELEFLHLSLLLNSQEKTEDQ
jgi:hypothetical protein